VYPSRTHSPEEKAVSANPRPPSRETNIGQAGHDRYSALRDDDIRLALGPAHCPQAVVLEQLAYNREIEIVRLRAEVARLRQGLEAAQGEAYLGALEDDPDPLAACHNVIRACQEALRA
jgi:hypothetical protein